MANPKFVGAVAVSAALAVGALVGASLGSPGVTSATGAGVSATTATTAPTAPDGPPPGDHGRGPGHGFGRGVELEAAATALGMSVDDLRTELQAGKSIAEVAKAKGVDRQKVIDAMVAAATKRLDEAKAALPERMADIVDGKKPEGAPDGMGGPDGPHGPDGMGAPDGMGGPGHGPRGFRDLSEVAKVLGLTEDALRTELQAGKSLAEVAKAKGIDVSKVIDALVAEAKTHLDEAVKAGKLTQAEADARLEEITEHLTDFVNGTAPQGRPGHP